MTPACYDWAQNNHNRVRECKKLENIKQETERLNINFLGICETRWIDNETYTIDDNRIIYVGRENERGVELMLDKDNMLPENSTN